MLTYPAGLYDDLMLRRYAKAFEAAIIAAKAANAAAVVESSAPGRTVFMLSWDS